jgi:hypothetical protein
MTGFRVHARLPSAGMNIQCGAFSAAEVSTLDAMA